MGKNKLSRFREIETFDRVFQPPFEEIFRKDSHLKGNWAQEVFGNNHPIVLELGCGKGEYTVGLARMEPGMNFIGVDIKGARIWKGARTAHLERIDNVAFLRTRIDFIESFFGKDEVREIWITFPDPQERKRRHKKRLTGALFLNRYSSFLVDGGVIHLKTDNFMFYRDTLELLQYNELPVIMSTDDLYASGLKGEVTSIQTYYESRFLSGGATIKYLRFKLPADKPVSELPGDDITEIEHT